MQCQARSRRISSFRVWQPKVPRPRKIDRAAVEKACLTVKGKEIFLCHLAQKEETLSARCELLKKTATGQTDESQLSKLLEEREFTRKEFWFTERELFAQRMALPVSPLRRAYHLWRSQPARYLHPDLTENCAGQSGCCAGRIYIADRPYAAGHCTVECGCCAKTRGFDLGDHRDNNDRRDNNRACAIFNAPVHPSPNNDYYRRIMRAHMFGLGSGP
ncbi:hypothetical protein N7492_006308 [Penicillium capsulatum]|uniref:Uncharacterized protein n=1 Tax=Penicillium capsulatum TaxID=69766 RepID=A0A9W9I5D7_9EURO|nr:hypothetical protein N7492_006308 [Penicillium capsulatum]